MQHHVSWHGFSHRPAVYAHGRMPKPGSVALGGKAELSDPGRLFSKGLQTQGHILGSRVHLLEAVLLKTAFLTTESLIIIDPPEISLK